MKALGTGSGFLREKVEREIGSDSSGNAGQVWPRAVPLRGAAGVALRLLQVEEQTGIEPLDMLLHMPAEKMAESGRIL
jgi:hypothetical protein